MKTKFPKLFFAFMQNQSRVDKIASLPVCLRITQTYLLQKERSNGKTENTRVAKFFFYQEEWMFHFPLVGNDFSILSPNKMHFFTNSSQTSPLTILWVPTRGFLQFRGRYIAEAHSRKRSPSKVCLRGLKRNWKRRCSTVNNWKLPTKGTGCCTRVCTWLKK